MERKGSKREGANEIVKKGREGRKRKKKRDGRKRREKGRGMGEGR